MPSEPETSAQFISTHSPDGVAKVSRFFDQNLVYQLPEVQLEGPFFIYKTGNSYDSTYF